MSQRRVEWAALWLLAASAACSGRRPTSTSDAGFAHWIGLDSRPLAVGSQIAVTLEIDTDAGATPPFEVTSSNPEVVTVTGSDAGDPRVLLDVLGAGAATLELNAAGARTSLEVSTEVGVALQIWDAQRHAAGIGNPLALDGGPLDPKRPLDLLTSSQEVLQGVVLDATCQPLNSWGLVQPSTSLSTQIKISPLPAEQFILSAPQTVLTGSVLKFGLVDLSDGGIAGTDGGARADFCDAGNAVFFSTVNFSNVSVVSSAATVGLVSGVSDGLVVAAEAFASDGTEVLGIDDWSFRCAPPSTCVVMPFSPSVVGLTIPSNSGTSHSVSAVSASQTLTGKPLVIP